MATLYLQLSEGKHTSAAMFVAQQKVPLADASMTGTFILWAAFVDISFHQWLAVDRSVHLTARHVITIQCLVCRSTVTTSAIVTYCWHPHIVWLRHASLGLGLQHWFVHCAWVRLLIEHVGGSEAQGMNR